jgi:hypothetical protein
MVKIMKRETLSGSRSTSATSGASSRGSGSAIRPGQAQIAPSETKPASAAAAAAGALRQDVRRRIAMATAANVVHCMLKRPTTRANTASTDRAASAAVATQSGDASLSGVARCGSSAMNAAASASCRPTWTNSADAQPPAPSPSIWPIKARPQKNTPTTTAAASHNQRRKRASA